MDEGQASLGEALVTIHTCRLLLQPRRRFNVQSPTCHCPGGEGQSVVAAFASVFQHNTQHKVIAKDFALQIILFTLAYSEKTVNRYFKLISKNYLGHHQTRVTVSYSQESNVMCVTVQWEKVFYPQLHSAFSMPPVLPTPGLRLSRVTLLLYEGSPVMNSPGLGFGTGCLLPRPRYPSCSAWSRQRVLPAPLCECCTARRPGGCGANRLSRARQSPCS